MQKTFTTSAHPIRTLYANVTPLIKETTSTLRNSRSVCKLKSTYKPDKDFGISNIA